MDAVPVKNRGGGGASEFRVRARFYAIRQVDGERAYDWYRRALAAAVPCGFADDRPVADKFVTGLRPGPVADRLLGEPADGRLTDLVAAAVRVEGTVATQLTTANPTAPRAQPTPPDKTDDVLGEIREKLKLYRYSGEPAKQTASDYGDGYPSFINHHNNNNNNESPQAMSDENTIIDDTSSTTTLDGKLWWKNRIEKSSRQSKTTINKNKYSPLTCKSCCNLATTLLESFGKISPSLFLQPWTNMNRNSDSEEYFGKDQGYHDDSNCYCSSLNSDDRKINYRTMSKSANCCTNSKRFGFPKKMQCLVCDGDDKSFSQ